MTYAVQDLVRSLRAARLARGLSQRDLGERVGLPQSHISKIENGGTDIKLSSLIEIARALELELELVPRSTLPAVASLIKASQPAEEGSATSRAVDRIHRAQAVAERVGQIPSCRAIVEKFQRTLSILEGQKFNAVDLSALSKALEPIERVSRRIGEWNAPLKKVAELSNVSRRFRESNRSLDELRSRISDVPLQPLQLPAYRLDEDEDA